MNEVKVIGMEDINRRLNEFEDKIARKHLKDSLRAVSVPIVKSIKNNIRGKLKKRKGTLLRSIGSWFFNKAGSGTIYVGPKTGRRAKYDAWYAHFLEFGTSGFGKRVRTKIGVKIGYSKKGAGIHARPFIRPAWDEHKGNITDNLGKELKHRTGL